jgi:hypothetical protein
LLRGWTRTSQPERHLELPLELVLQRANELLCLGTSLEVRQRRVDERGAVHFAPKPGEQCLGADRVRRQRASPESVERRGVWAPFETDRGARRAVRQGLEGVMVASFGQASR